MQKDLFENSSVRQPFGTRYIEFLSETQQLSELWSADRLKSIIGDTIDIAF